MPKALLRLFLATLASVTLVSASAAASAPAPACGDCCTYSAVPNGCASMCAPDVPTAQPDEQSPAKPLASAASAARGSFLVAIRTELLVPAAVTRTHGPPAYLRFGRLLL